MQTSKTHIDREFFDVKTLFTVSIKNQFSAPNNDVNKAHQKKFPLDMCISFRYLFQQ